MEDPLSCIDTLARHTGKADPARAERHLGSLLVAEERIEHAFMLGRDMLVFTDRRLLLSTRAPGNGRGVEHLSLPYRSITHFSADSADTSTPGASLNIWLSGQAAPVRTRFGKRLDAYGVQTLLAAYVLDGKPGTAR